MDFLSNLVGTTPNKQSSQKAASGSAGISRGFQLFIQSVNKHTSAYEEEQSIKRELSTLQQDITQASVSMSQIRDYLCRVIYCHILGHDVSWAYIHAVKLAQQGTQIDKKTGYLACCLLLHRDHELVLLLINTIQRDLKSSSIVDNMVALSAASQLVPSEMIPGMLPFVLEKLKHSREMVRQKAVLCLFQFQLLAPELLDHSHEDLHMALFDKDPGVMATAVHIVHNNIQREPEKYEDLGGSLLKILQQIISRKISAMFEYHSIPLPWLQIKILGCLTKLAGVHESIRVQGLSPLLKDVLQRTNLKENMAFAILYECVVCIVAIQPEHSLLEEAAKHVARFVRSSDPNLKYIGVKALVSLVQVNKQYAVDYQELIVQSLENTDLNIQRKMYKLLYQIANQTNVEVITTKLLHQLTLTLDKFWRSEVIIMVIKLAERFEESRQWQVNTLFTCVQLGGQNIDKTVINTVISLLQAGYTGSEVDQKSQYFLVQKAVSFMLTDKTVPPLIHISAWVLGELCSLMKKMQEDKVISIFLKHLSNTVLPYSVKTSLVSALQKLLVKKVVNSVTMATKLTECLQMQHSVVIKQQLSVLLEVCRQDLTLQYQDDASIDTTLSFLDDHVSVYLEAGATPYTSVHQRVTSSAPQRDSTEYTIPPPHKDTASSGSQLQTGSSTSSTQTLDDIEPGLKISGVKKVWGKQGRLNTAPVYMATDASVTDQGSLQTEDEKQQKELASALFSGLQTTKKNPGAPNMFNAHNTGDFSLISSDMAGWRNLHSTLSQPETSTNDINYTPTTEAGDISKEPNRPNILHNDWEETNSNHNTDSQNSDLVNVTSKNDVPNDLTSPKESVFPLSNGNADISTNEELDEALSLLLSDNSSFLNISVSSNDQSRISVSRVSYSTPHTESSQDCTRDDPDTLQLPIPSPDTSGICQAELQLSGINNFTQTQVDVSHLETCIEETSLYSEQSSDGTAQTKCDSSSITDGNNLSVYSNDS